MKLNKQKAINSVKQISKKLKISIEQAALGIIGIVNSNMTRAIRAVSVERGHDPRLFSLMPFGGLEVFMQSILQESYQLKIL